MSTVYVCDWCQDEFNDRAQVAHVDITVGQHTGSYHLCAECAPDSVKQHFPPEGAENNAVTDGGTLTVCPECDCTTIERRTNAPDGPTSDGTWYCVACGIHFDEPNKRAPKGKQHVNRGYAKHLDQMAPDDLVTDGGGRDE